MGQVHGDDWRISTVFIGVNHEVGKGKPVLYETMVFGTKIDQLMMRYNSLDDAIKGHEEVEAMVCEAL